MGFSWFVSSWQLCYFGKKTIEFNLVSTWAHTWLFRIVHVLSLREKLTVSKTLNHKRILIHDMC